MPMYKHICIYTYLYMSVYIYICMYTVSIHIYIHIYIYICVCVCTGKLYMRGWSLLRCVPQLSPLVHDGDEAPDGLPFNQDFKP